MAVLTARFLSVWVCVSMRQRDREGQREVDEAGPGPRDFVSHYHPIITFSQLPLPHSALRQTTPDSPQAYSLLQTTRKTRRRRRLRFIPPDGAVSLTKKNKSGSKCNGRFKHIIALNGEKLEWASIKQIASCHRKRERKRKTEHVNSPGWWERGCGLTERVRSHSAGCLLLWMDVDQWKRCTRPLCEDERDAGGWEEPKTVEPRRAWNNWQVGLCS